jgi:hypothetical protein
MCNRFNDPVCPLCGNPPADPRFLHGSVVCAGCITTCQVCGWVCVPNEPTCEACKRLLSPEVA